MKLGYLIDPVIALYSPDGSLLAFADDRLQQNGAQPPNLDPYLVYTFQKAGRYLVQLRDSAERGSPDYVYHLAIRRIDPDFELRALTSFDNVVSRADRAAPGQGPAERRMGHPRRSLGRRPAARHPCG